MTCPVCEGKLTVKQIHEAWDKELDALLCQEHLSKLASYFIEKEMS